MQLVWHGLSCFRLTERGMGSIVTDPYSPEIGLPELKLRGDVVTVSHNAPGHSFLKAVRGVRRVIDGPGEYEIGGVFITGIQMRQRKSQEESRPNILYVFDYEGVTVAHLGDLDYVPSQGQIESLGAVDVALVPVGGNKALSAARAAEVISLIEPSIVVPMHYRTGKEKLELDEISRFLSEMGVSEPETSKSLSVTKTGVPDQTQVVVLEPAWLNK
jgi:L-ascorbate metabolism protein UlaG (beta-lactamase superfamily)